MMSISIFVCAGIGVFTIVAFILETLKRRRLERHTIADSIETMERLMEAVSELPQLQPKERPARRRAIAREILLDNEFLLYLVIAGYADDPPQSEEVQKQTQAVMRQIQQLIWQLRKSLFLFRFTPRLIGDCRRILDAALGHARAWIAYVQLLKAKYPERYGDFSALDIP